MILSRAATILYTSIAILASGVKAQTDRAKVNKSPTKGKTSKSPTKVCTEDSGIEIFSDLPLADAKVKFEGVVDCETQTYTLKFSFEPDKNLPYMNGVTKVDQNGLAAHPEKAATCLAEGLGPGLTENIPAGSQIAKNEHYTIHVGSYNTSKRIREATGYKMLTMSVAPCGTPFQAYSHYGVYFYNIDTEFRKSMTCDSNYGYFCEFANEQCSASAAGYQLTGEGLERCDDGVTYANVPSGFTWSIDDPNIGANAAMPALGLHGMDLSDLGPIFTGVYETPLTFQVQYDSNQIGHFLAIWAGTPLGQNDPGNDYNWSRSFVYNCHNTAKYPSLPTKKSVDYVAAEGRTYVTVTGPTTQCKESFTETWDSTDPSSKSGKDAKKAVFN